MENTFKPNIQWMAEKYNEMNEKLFNGELGACDFDIFTKGRGSQGGVLGWFKITGRNLKVDRHTRRMYQYYDGWDKTFVNKGNFVEICKPRIELNGNYSGTETGFLATLVHEMCHYYTYMSGYCPKQGHGREFRQIGQIVSARSNGLFTIQRLASAEQMSQLELNDEMKMKREKRLNNKKASVTAIIVTTKEGKVKLTITSNKNLINLITTSEKYERNENVVTTNDSDIIDYLFNKGYRKNMRTWRYWSLEDKPWLGELNNMLAKTEVETPVGSDKSQPTPQAKQPRRIFSIKTSNGTFEYDGSSFHSLQKALRERFPKMNDEIINKIINNPGNYRMEENRKNIKTVIREVVEDFVSNNGEGGDIDINPDMNLGLQSPLEIE